MNVHWDPRSLSYYWSCIWGCAAADGFSSYAAASEDFELHRCDGSES